MTSVYHHGALRAALLDEARRMLHDQGPGALTLRELARRTGVSHGAPGRHFADRDELLDALAAQGFEELTGQLERAAVGGDFSARFRAYAHAHVQFALAEGHLMDLMFSRIDVRADGSVTAATEAANRFFALGASMLGEREQRQIGPLPYLLAGTLEGISSLAASGRLPHDRVEEVTDVAVTLMLPAVLAQLN
jgi:AcrR family transcriptional regulator